MSLRRVLLVSAALLLFLMTALGQTPKLQKMFEDALSAQNRGDFKQAIQGYREVLKVKPDVLPAWMNLGVLLVKTGQYAEALECYRSALALAPQNRDIRFYIALAYFKKGDTPNASRQFEELLKEDPGDLRAAILLGATDVQAGNNARALAVLAPFAGAARENTDFLWAYGSALIANGHLRDGLAAAEQVAKETNRPEAWLLAGQTLLRVDEFVRAKDDLENAARLDSTMPGVENALGHAREKVADYQGAIEAYSKAVAQQPNDADAWLGLGGNEYFQRDLKGARTSLQRALALDHGSAPAFYALGLVEKAQSNPQVAITDLEKAVKLRPDWMEAHVQLAALYFQLHRTADGARERQLVDRLAENQQKAGPGNP